jgi:hypothetical protein
MALKDIFTGLAAGLQAGDRAYLYEQGRYAGTVTGRGDGGVDITDGHGRYAGSVKRGIGSPGFDVYDGRGLYRGTLKR